MNNLLTLTGVAVAAYLLYQYMQDGHSSPAVTSSAPGQLSLDQPNNSPTAGMAWRMPSAATNFAPGQIAAPYYGSPQGQTQPVQGYRAAAPDPYFSAQVDTAYYKPQPMVIAVDNPAATPNMTQEQLRFQSECTYIDGSWKPGCR